MNKPSAQQKGFTLLELVTAIGLFSVVIIITASAFTRFVDTQRREIDEQAFQEDIRLAMGLFNREARGGFGDTYLAETLVGPDGALGTEDDESSIFFLNQNLRCVRYFIRERQLFRNQSLTAGSHDNCTDIVHYDSINDRVLTGDDSTILTMSFRVQQSEVDCDNFVPPQVLRRGFITVLLEAEAAAKGNPLQLQSAVTSRQAIASNDTTACG